MPAHIRSVPAPSKQVLRDLVAGSLEAIIGPCSVINPELPCTGGPILALDAQRRATLISFEPDDGAQALLNGLAAWHETQAGDRWVRHLYPELSRSASGGTARLVVLIPAPLPGAALLANTDDLSVFTFRVFTVNNEAALLVEPTGIPHRAISSYSNADAIPAESGDEPGLTEEESDFLGQIG
ncbi:MAG: hypothetical protein ACYDDO_10070 [Acidiferrobacterales bacterium]